MNGGPNTGDLASYGATGITPFQNDLVQSVPTGTFAATLTGGAADIVKLVTNNGTATLTTVTGTLNQTLGALVFANANLANNTAATTNNVQLTPAGTPSIASGAILTLSSGTAANSTNTVSLGSGAIGSYLLGGESYLFQNTQAGGNTNFLGPISGPGTLDIAGSNAVFLSTTNNTAWTGGATLNAGTTVVQGAGTSCPGRSP